MKSPAEIIEVKLYCRPAIFNKFITESIRARGFVIRELFYNITNLSSGELCFKV